MAEQENDIKLPSVTEPYVKFKSLSDKTVYQVINEELEQPLVEISGYDLQFRFNGEHLRSLKEIDAAARGIADLFRQIMLEKMLDQSKQNEQ